MQIDIATISEYAIIDQVGRMSVLGIFDTMGAQQMPLVHPRFFICLRLGCRPIEANTQHTVSVVVQDQDGHQRAKVEGPFTVPVGQAMPDGPIAVQMVFEFAGVQFLRTGQHSVEIAIDAQHRTSLPLIVVQGARPPQQPR